MDSDYKRGQISMWSFLNGWLALLERIEREPFTSPEVPGKVSNYAAIQELRALEEAMQRHITGLDRESR